MIKELVQFTVNRVRNLQANIYISLLEYLFQSIRTDSDGIIRYTNTNINSLAKVDKFISKKIEKKDHALKQFILRSIFQVISQSVGQYASVDVRAIETGRRTTERLMDHATKKVDQITDLTSIFAQFKQQATSLISRPEGISLKEMRQLLEKDFGDKGILSTQFNRWTYDIYSQYDRVAGNEMRKTLGLKYAIYEGGEIETTRPFCDERNGKVYSEEEILSWANLDFKGKPDIAYNPIIDCGGYNCRHKLRWISTELALKLRDGRP